MNRQCACSRFSLGAALVLVAGAAVAQPDPQATPTAARPGSVEAPKELVQSAVLRRRDTLKSMERLITIKFNEHRLEDVMKFIGEIAGVEMEVLWSDERNTVGLDREAPITLAFEKGTALELLEKVLSKAAAEAGSSTWQLSASGGLQVGPKERLNNYRYVKSYLIADLLVEIPDYRNAPDFDLQSVLQNQGGGGQSPFKDTTQSAIDKTPLPDRVRELQEVLTSFIETEQWVVNGGSGASIRFFQGSFLVRAPDYIHRQIDGYPKGSRAPGAVTTERWASAGGRAPDGVCFVSSRPDPVAQGAAKIDGGLRASPPALPLPRDH